MLCSAILHKVARLCPTAAQRNLQRHTTLSIDMVMLVDRGGEFFTNAAYFRDLGFCCALKPLLPAEVF